MNNTILIIGRYHEPETLSGSQKFIKRLFENIPSDKQEILFLDFFFGYKSSQIFKKIFFYKLLRKRGLVSFIKIGILPILILVFYKRPKSILVSGLEGYGLLIIILVKLFGSKVIYVAHGIYSYELINDKNNNDKTFYKLKYYFLERSIILMSDLITLFSKKEYEMLKNKYSIQKKNIKILVHGVDEKFFFEKKIFNHDKPLKIIYTGGYGRQLKGFDFLINTLAKVDFPIELFICGRMIEAELGEKIVNIKTNVKIQICGYLNSCDLSKLLRDMDVFILPSKFETFSISTVEAMASSLCCIITNTTGVANYFSDGNDVILINYDDIEGLYLSLKKLNYNRIYLEEISKTAFDSSKRFQWESVTRDYLDLLNSK